MGIVLHTHAHGRSAEAVGVGATDRPWSGGVVVLAAASLVVVELLHVVKTARWWERKRKKGLSAGLA